MAGAAAVALVAAAYLPFALALAPRFRALFIFSALVFVGGALGVEMFAGAQSARWHESTLACAVCVLVEEGMEMAGVVILVYTLLAFVAAHFPGLVLSVAPAREPVAAGTWRAPAATPRGGVRLPPGVRTPATHLGYRSRPTPSGRPADDPG